MIRVVRFLRALLLLVALPFLILIPAIALFLADLVWAIAGRRRLPVDTAADRTAATIVIPNWNGRDLLEKYLPSVVEAASGNPRNEVLVVDNGSTDGSADFLRQNFAGVRVLALDKNLGFGGGSNAGFRAAKNDVVVLLNSDMRVAPDFLAPLLAAFEDPQAFAASCQILFTDPAKLREETGLTQAWWQDGAIRVRHRLDDSITGRFPCFYAGGGSSAFDRRKFLALGGFDEIYRPFYGEDTDLGMMAWKRGWKVFYEPASLVWHEHRGTIGRKFSPAYIDGVLQKNFVLFAWKNIHEPARLVSHFLHAWGGASISLFAGDSRERVSTAGLARALLQLPGALRSRWRARSLASVSDSEAFRRPLGGYFRDRFDASPAPEKLRVLFLSPYPILPPIHGGAVFMSQTVRELAPLVDLHLIVLLDSEAQREDHAGLHENCASVEHLVRVSSDDHGWGSARPHAVREFFNRDLEWLIHRQILLHEIDVLQIEYANMGQYALDFRRIAACLFEHDVYFQTVGRQRNQASGWLRKARFSLEYLRAMPWELKMLRQMDRVQVCTVDNGEYLSSFDRSLAPKILPGVRAGIDTSRYDFAVNGRTPETMLFVGSFRHLPNQEALMWLTSSVLPAVLQKRPGARLLIVGSDPPPPHVLPSQGGAIEIRGFVPDVRDAFREPAVFVCPILAGSGVRVKLLEAFASGIPCVSTRIGAEGLARTPGEFCRLADDPEAFANEIIDLFDRPDVEMVTRARREVEENWDMRAITVKLLESYRAAYEAKSRPATIRP